MLAVLEDPVEATKVALDLVDVEHLDGPDAIRLVKVLAPLGRKLSAITNAAGTRVASTDAWTRTGSRSASTGWPATTGTGVGQAKEALATQERLEGGSRM